MFRWTTCVRLDHLNAVGPPGSRNTVVQRNASGPTARKWSKRAGRVTTCETPSHHARRPVGRSRCGTPEPPRRPNRPAPGSRRPERAGPPPTTGSRRARPRRRTRRRPCGRGARTSRAARPQHTQRRLERIITVGPASPRPNALNGPSHHTRQTHSDAPNNLPGEEESFERDVSDLHAPRLQSHPLNNRLGTAMAPQSRKGSLASSSSSDWGTRISS